ncbi:MAG: HD domain-containing protein [Pirellulaceae bacterium]
MLQLEDIPEIRSLTLRQDLLRIPDQLDIPLSPRVRNIIDTPEFRRLSRISQLGLVSLVYPAAHHSRFEHSLGVYRLALLYLQQLAGDERFIKLISTSDAEVLIVAALLHDLGHWPFCHPIEDMRLPGVPEHEMFANSFLLEGEIADLLRDEWGIQPRDVVSLLSAKPRAPSARVLQSILSGPIDIDKMDYLQRDSLHAGVPYGKNFDQQRLIASLCLNSNDTGLAIRDKGKTAAEMMVFSRYVMFSEVYWHHAVRAATAMLQRAFYLLHHTLDLDRLFRLTEHAFTRAMRDAAGNGPARDLLEGLFGPTRVLYKRTAQFSYFQDHDRYMQLARRPYPWLAACAEELALRLSHQLGSRVAPHEVLIDAPPTQLEVEFKIEVHFPKESIYRELGEVSPVVQTLAKKQFDDYVKRVRVFLHPRVRDALGPAEELGPLLDAAITAMER